MDKKEFARQLRHQMTDAEHLLWRHLRSRRLAGYKFRRQVPVGNYIADFLSYESRMIIEVDGGQHAVRKEYDTRRDNWLREQGFRILRLPDNVVLKQRQVALEAIWQELQKPPPLQEKGRS
jgi:very-short-patch-repair endonuclease